MNAERPRGTGPFYVVALAATAVSIDTSWRFFGDRLHITNPLERGAMFAALEMALVACGYAMAQNVRRPGGKPGPARMFAWALCGLSGYMAVDLAGPVEGAARVILGPVLALVALHLALGIEIRAHRGSNTGTWAKVAAEIRERFLSRLNLGNDERDAVQRSQDRARNRAARLVTTKHALWKSRRLARAIRASGSDRSASQRDILLEQVAVQRNINDLSTIEIDSPWVTAVPLHVQRLVDAAQRGAEALREAAQHDAAAVLAEAEKGAADLRGEALRLRDEAAQRSASSVAAAQQEIGQRHREVAAEAGATRSAAEQAAAAIVERAERAAREQSEQLIAAARAEAQQIRSAALAEIRALRDTASTASPQRRIEAPSKRFVPPVDAPATPSAEALTDALDDEFRSDVPSLRDAAKHLRKTFGSCSDKRVADAVSALRVRRGEAREADTERIHLTAINGHRILEEATP